MSEDAEKPADDGVDDSEDSDTVENAQSDEDRPNDLTPEQVEAFRRRIEKIGRVPEIKLPDMSFKNFDTMAKIISQTVKNPTLELEADWKKKISAMLPAVKAHAEWQKRIDALMPKALKFSTIDFTVFDASLRIVEQQTAWLGNLDTAIAAMQASFYPRNLRAIADLEWEDVEQVVMVDGIPLYGVVRTEIAEALIRADSTDERREILGHRLADISADCRTAVQACTSVPVASYVPFVINALDALDAGYTEPAQALAGSLVDTIVSGYFGDNRTKYTPHPRGNRTTAAYDEFTVREYIAFAPIWQAYQQFHADEGDPVPTTFSRHATAHAVSAEQYTERNAIQALMLVCTLLHRFDEEGQKLETAEASS